MTPPTNRPSRWGWDGAVSQSPVKAPKKIARRVTIVHSGLGFKWRLVGSLGEQYAQGWTRRLAAAVRAGRQAKDDWEARDALQQHEAARKLDP